MAPEATWPAARSMRAEAATAQSASAASDTKVGQKLLPIAIFSTKRWLGNGRTRAFVVHSVRRYLVQSVENRRPFRLRPTRQCPPQKPPPRACPSPDARRRILRLKTARRRWSPIPVPSRGATGPANRARAAIRPRRVSATTPVRRDAPWHRRRPTCVAATGGVANVTTTHTTVVTPTVHSKIVVLATAWPDLSRDEKSERYCERRKHRAHLAPGIDAPPKPSQQINQARAGTDRKQEVERVFGGDEKQREPDARGHQQHRDDAPRQDEIALARFRVARSAGRNRERGTTCPNSDAFRSSSGTRRKVRQP